METTQSKTFSIKTEIFEGPLDLLLSLIEKRKLLINDIALAKIADDYISHVQQFEQFPIAESATFILIASALLLIKSKSLLPSLELSQEEQGNIDDLQKRLKIYQKFKQLSHHIQCNFAKTIIFYRQFDPGTISVFAPQTPHNEITVNNFLSAIKNVLHNLPKKELIPKAIVRKVISLEEMISNLTTRIQNSLKMSFKEFSGMGKQEKVSVIVGFLAMLELVKQGIINVSQEARFGDIDMESQDISVPRYN